MKVTFMMTFPACFSSMAGQTMASGQQRLSAQENPWSESSFRQRLKRISQVLSSMKQKIAEETTSPTQVQFKQEQLGQMQLEVTQLFSLLDSPDAMQQFETLKQRVRKKRSQKAWRKRKQQAAKAERHMVQALRQTREKEIDEWMARRQEKEKEALEAKLKAAEAEERAHKREQKLKEIERMRELLATLQLLQKLRRAKLRRQGRLVPEEDASFLERVRASHEEELRQAKAAMEAKASTDKKETDGKDTDAAAPSSTTVPTSDNNKNTHPTAQSVHDFYFGANENLDVLIANRRAWDAYLVPKGQGSRVPQHFIAAPLPSSAQWASYVVR